MGKMCRNHSLLLSVIVVSYINNKFKLVYTCVSFYNSFILFSCDTYLDEALKFKKEKKLETSIFFLQP